MLDSRVPSQLQDFWVIVTWKKNVKWIVKMSSSFLILLLRLNKIGDTSNKDKAQTN